MNLLATEFQRQVAAYANTAENNDQIFADYTAATAADPLLASHRAYVDQHKLGFGDPAFHAMWQQLLATAHERFGDVDALEIGVFKGQVVSLWALLAKSYGWPVRVHGITPFEGQPLPGAGWWRALQSKLNPWFRERVRSGDFYAKDDYAEIVRRHFVHHNIDFDAVCWVRGYSNDPAVLGAVRNDRFHVIYIDGGHTYEAASTDIANFAPKVMPGGWLVMDDASYDLPGTAFWKGYESVARACHLLPNLGFKNVLNVGHNRIFEKKLTMARVRVYLLTYRRPVLLRRAVESLRAQTCTDWICELHNDDPADHSPADLMRELGDQRILLRQHERNLGAVASFNLVFSAVAEPFISLLEDDNWWEPTLLARLLEELDRRPECDVSWANMRLCREEPDGSWTDTGQTIWPIVSRPALTIAWPQPLQIDTALHSNGAMLLRTADIERFRLPSTVPFDSMEQFRDRAFRSPLVFVPEPLGNFALTRETTRSHHAGDWLESQTLQAASFLKHVCLDAAAIAHLWRARREALPPAIAPLFFAGLLEPQSGFLRGATTRDWFRFFCGLIRHPWLAARALTARRRKAELWKDLDRVTEQTGRHAVAPADVPAGRLASRSDLPASLKIPR